MADYQKHKNNKIRAGLVVLGLLCLSIGLIGQYQTNALTTSASVGGQGTAHLLCRYGRKEGGIVL